MASEQRKLKCHRWMSRRIRRSVGYDDLAKPVTCIGFGLVMHLTSCINYLIGATDGRVDEIYDNEGVPAASVAVVPVASLLLLSSSPPRLHWCISIVAKTKKVARSSHHLYKL